MSDHKQRIAELFERALDFEPVERAAFLAGACGNDVNLRRRVEDLLAAHGQQSGFLPEEGGTTESAPTVLDAVKLTEGAGALIGRYKLLEKLGEGGFGSVWAAEQREPVKRRVALKIIKLGMDTKQVVARFEAERQALAMMDHPNIAKVLDAGTTDTGRPFFVMELVKGIPITKYCEHEKLATQARLDLFIKVCQAIQHAHQKGIIHRDIKPSNIMVTLHDGVPVPKVIDFGIAKATQQELTELTIYTQHHQFIGTPAYMSPEQAEMSGLDIDTRSDIYSLGVLLYELLTGKTPFDAKELMQSGIDEMRRIIREQEPVRPSTKLSQTLAASEVGRVAPRAPGLANEVPAGGAHGMTRPTTEEVRASSRRLLQELRGDLDWIVMKCLEKDRTRRYETANGLAADLKRHLSNEPVSARPPSAVYQFQKAWRRNKLSYTAGLAVAAALIAGLAISMWQYAGKSAAEREQSRLREQAEAKALEASEARALASQQRDLARDRLYDSLLREARTIRKSRQVGYRREVFDRLKQAFEFSPTNSSASRMRTEFVAALGDWVGLEPVDVAAAGGFGIGELTADGTLAALAQLTNAAVSLRETRTGREVASLDVAGFVWSLAFDQRGLALYAFTTERGFMDFNPERPKRLQLEKWFARADGTWQREWLRSLPGFNQLVLTTEGPVALGLEADDRRLRVLDLDRDAVLATLAITNRVPLYPSVDIRADRQQVAFSSLEGGNDFDHQIEVWDVRTNQRATVIKPRLGRAVGLAFSPDGQHLAANFENTLVVFETGQYGRTLSFQGSFESTMGGRIGGNDLLAVPSVQERVVSLIHVGSGREVTQLAAPSTISQAFSRDGSVLLLTHTEGARLVRLGVERERQRLAAHQGGVPAVEFSPDGRQLVSAGKDRTLRSWDLTARGASRVLGHLPAPGQTLAFTPDGAHLVCGYYNIGELSIWSVATGQKVGEVKEDPKLAGTTWACGVGPDGKYVAASGGGLRVWRRAELPGAAGLPARSPPPWLVDTNGVAGVVFDPAGRRVAFLGVWSNQPFYTGVHTLDLAGAGPSRLIATNSHPNFVQSISFLPRSGSLAYLTRDREIALVEPDSGRVLKVISTLAPGEVPQAFVANLRASPDESRLAVANSTGMGVDLWDPATGELLYSLPEETGSVWWLAWSPDSQRLAVSRATGDISVWNLKEIEAQLAPFGLKP